MRLLNPLLLILTFLSPSVALAWDYCGAWDRHEAECVNGIGPGQENCLYDGQTGQCYVWQYMSYARPDNCPDSTFGFVGSSWVGYAESSQNALDECTAHASPCGQAPAECHVYNKTTFKRS